MEKMYISRYIMSFTEDKSKKKIYHVRVLNLMPKIKINNSFN